jgi:hypothetical protein
MKPSLWHPKMWRNIFGDVSKAKGWEHGSGEGGHFEVIDELDKEDE